MKKGVYETCMSKLSHCTMCNFTKVFLFALKLLDESQC